MNGTETVDDAHPDFTHVMWGFRDFFINHYKDLYETASIVSFMMFYGSLRDSIQWVWKMKLFSFLRQMAYVHGFFGSFRGGLCFLPT